MSKFSVTGGDGSFRVDIDTTAAELSIQAAPKVSYFRLRDYFFKMLIRHRAYWLSTKSSGFGRGDGDAGDPIGVSRVQSERESSKPNEVLYVFQPAQKRAGTAREAELLLNRMSANISTGNVVLPVHEFGTDITSSKYMALPVRTRLGKRGRGLKVTPENWRKANPDKTLTLRKGRAGKLFLYEVVPVYSRANKRRGITKEHVQDRLKMRFVLTKRVEMDPTLRFYESWDSLEGYREREWGVALNKIQQDFNKFDPRDR